MFRLKIFYRNANVHLLKQLQQWSIPSAGRKVSVKSFSSNVNGNKSNGQENTHVSTNIQADTAIAALKRSVKEQVR